MSVRAGSWPTTGTGSGRPSIERRRSTKRCVLVTLTHLFDDIASLSGIQPGGRILEIGCGTGQATVPFARRGYRILCVELGENMAAVARRNLEGNPQAEVRTGAFEDWPLQDEAFDVAISATAFHWLNPATAYPKVAGALRDGG